tara:strand:+ start:3388 stop:3969 length:582 start_codon:yes stop_codon:yes gene_type:complete
VARLIGNRKNVAVFISGRGSNLKYLIKNSKNKNSLFRVNLVISNKPKALGLKFAKKSKIKFYVIKYKNINTSEIQLLKLLKKFKVELICLAGFMKIISKNFIDKFNKPILNIHPSLLPKYKGLNTHFRVLKNKEKYSGSTVHLVTPKLDSGKIILQKKIKLFKADDVKSLEKKILKLEHKIYSAAVYKFLSNL